MIKDSHNCQQVSEVQTALFPALAKLYLHQRTKQAEIEKKKITKHETRIWQTQNQYNLISIGTNMKMKNSLFQGRKERKT